MSKINGGIYPTMLTPYKNGEIDYGMVRELVDWYVEMGCHGIFAVCQSSEMWYLSLKERVKLAETVVDQVNGRISVVASGHCGNSIDEQVQEMNEISKTGVDAFVLVSNRFDIHNDGDDVWIENAERFLDKADPDMDLGLYECPVPYKRVLSDRLIDWCGQNPRFRFIKDTCCDPVMLKSRGDILKNSNLMLFNANGQTLLYSLRNGTSGYSGIMANFHPDLLSWLYENYEKEPEKADCLSNILSMAACTENPAYPCIAKYYLNLEGLKMDIFARSCDQKKLTPYQKSIMDQLFALNKDLRKFIGGKV